MPCRGADDAEVAQAEQVALAAHRTLGCRDASRVDIRSDGQGRPHFMEVNPVAGLHPKDSDLPMICGFFGMTYQELIEQIVAAASCRVTETAAGRRVLGRLKPGLAHLVAALRTWTPGAYEHRYPAQRGFQRRFSGRSGHAGPGQVDLRFALPAGPPRRGGATAPWIWPRCGRPCWNAARNWSSTSSNRWGGPTRCSIWPRRCWTPSGCLTRATRPRPSSRPTIS